MNAKWTSEDVPGQQGRLAVVTGANTGLGFETARVLAARGASVVLAVRDIEKGKRAAARIAGTAPGADVMVQPLDLTSLDSIRAAADELRAKHPRIDLLINNAGVMFTPKQTTRDGFELQFGNQPPGALRPHRAAARADAAGARLPRGDGQQPRPPHPGPDQLRRPAGQRSYSRVGAYSQSKLANLMFTYELQRRLTGAGTTIAVAAHPGLANTDLTRNSPAIAAFVYQRVLSQNAGDGRTARAARRDRPRRARRPVLRPARILRGQGLPETGPVQPAIPRHGHPAPPVDSLRTADRSHLPGRPSSAE